MIKPLSKTIIASEHIEQVRLVNWFKINFPDFIIFSIPNEGKRTNGNRFVSTGLTKGISDLAILLPNGKIVFMEMKKQKGGKLSDYQANFIKKCESLGHIALIGYGASDASEKILKELSKTT